MSQGKKDKFLPVFFGALGLGAVALGYLAFSASSTADEAEKSFKDKLTELERLEKAPLSRTEDNAKKKKELVDAYVKKVQELSKVMEAYQVPINDKETATSFQAKLSEATKAVKETAASRGVKLNDKFDLGMGRYLAGDFPVPGAAPRLAAQLDGVVALTNAALEAGVLEIRTFTRQELPFETEKGEEVKSDPKAKKTAPVGKSAPGKSGDKKATAKDAAPVLDESKVLERLPISITLTGKNQSILKFLENIANATPEKNPHFFVIRTLKVENEVKDGPAKNLQVALEEKPDPDNKEAPPIKYDAAYILGFEQVMAQIEIDLVRFIPEPPPEEKGKKPAETASVTGNSNATPAN
jgi:hypothetical protein